MIRDSFNLVIASIILLSLALVEVSAGTEALKFKRRLDRTEICKHGQIYSDMLRDTSVMKHPVIERKFMRLAKEVWYERWTTGNKLELTDERIECDYSGRKFGWYIKNKYYRLARNLEGDTFVRVWLYLAPRSGSNLPKDIIVRFKRSGRTIMEKLLPKISYESNRDDNVVNRVIYSGSGPVTGFSRLVYEVVKHNWEKFDNGLKKRVENFALKVIAESRRDITGLKVFGLSVLKDIGYSKEKLRNRLTFPPEDGESLQEVRKFELSAFFEDAARWRNEYPKWPVPKESGNKK